MFFIERTSPNLRRYGGEELGMMIEEMEGTWGAIRPQTSTVTYRLVQSDLLNRCYSVTTSDSGNAIDVYCYLTQYADCWKITAVRSLAMTQFAFAALSNLEGKDGLTPKEQRRLENIRLQIACDSALRKHLLDNQAEFDSLALLSLADSTIQAEVDDCLQSQDVVDPEGVASIICKSLASLHLRHLSRSTECKSCPELLVGGMLDDAVYYLYVPEGKEPPRMTPSEFILVDKITDRWYLIKTT